MKALILGIVLATIVSVSTSALSVGVAQPTQTLQVVQATPLSVASPESANILQ